jgi:hypothetical protein
VCGGVFAYPCHVIDTDGWSVRQGTWWTKPLQRMMRMPTASRWHHPMSAAHRSFIEWGVFLAWPRPPSAFAPLSPLSQAGWQPQRCWQ